MRNIKQIYSKTAFSIIEVMIGVFIFSLWLVAIYALLISSLSLSEYNKNAIIASQLAVEQIELIRNVRDTNYKITAAWDNIPRGWNFTKGFFTVENDPLNWHVHITEIPNFREWVSELANMESYRLCLSPDNVYIYDCSSARETYFYRYLQIEPIDTKQLKLTSKVIWHARWYHEFDIQTIITDWRRL